MAGTPSSSGSSSATPKLLVAIVGPTASGKSSLGVWLAERLNGEILACDSTQVYRGFDVGTAKPSLAERRGIPHRLIDLLEPSEVFTAGEYRKRAIGVLQEIGSRGRLPIMTVGTGLYLRALLEGLADAPLRSEDLRKRLLRRAERNRPGYLHRLLARMDPAAAERIGAHDTPKLVRAIEVCILAGKPITEVHRSGGKSLPGFRPIKIGLNPPRTALYERIERRTVEMIENGWLDEVKTLVAQGVAKERQTAVFHRLPGAARTRGREDGVAQRHFRDPAGHAEICEEATHLVSKRVRREMVRRIWRRSAISRSLRCSTFKRS